MGVSCRIHIKKTEEGIHRAGQPLRGILSYAVDEPTVFQTGVLSFIGQANCTWTEYGHNNRRPVRYTGHDEFLSMHVDIFKKRPDETVTLDVGTYEFHFEFVLPAEIPCSFHDGYGNNLFETTIIHSMFVSSNVSYHVKVKFAKPSLFSIANKFEREITVYGNVNPVAAVESQTFEIHKRLFKWFTNVEHIVHVKAKMAKTFLTPGENATLDLFVQNDTDTEIPHITTELNCRKTYTGKYLFTEHRTKVVTVGITGCAGRSPPVPAYKTAHFVCVVPTQPHLYSIQHCKVIKKEYYIKVTVNLPFPHQNATCEVPIVIGENRQAENREAENRQAESLGVLEWGDDFEIVSEPGDSDAPPSYWEVMKVDNSQDESARK